jgi:hypothetical protein
VTYHQTPDPSDDVPVELPKVTRLEVIDYSLDHPRPYSSWDVSIDARLQDDGRTLKIFVTHRPRPRG